MKKLLLILLCLPIIGFGQTPQVGDLYQGGIVFYVGDNSGLICDLHDLNNTASIEPYDQPFWGNNEVIEGADASEIGSGLQNTLDILSAFSELGIAADLCNESNSGGYSDWYLPSYDEAALILNNYELINSYLIDNGGSEFLMGESYWTSTEENQNLAFKMEFYNSFQLDGGTKQSPNYVRAIRTFILPTWTCENGSCIDPGDGSGSYFSLEECEALCFEDSWNCFNDACVDPGDGSGIYSSLANCETDCWLESWDCINNSCVDPLDGSGAYTSLSNCEKECIIGPSWNCVNDACVDPGDGSGFYSALADCEAGCHTSSITDPNKANKNLKKITNLLGQETPIRKNTPMFYIYDDGTVEKKVIIE